jgi:lysylphosphatidylglycerol synthetase-like protein (DUF2156 family)
MTDYDSRHRSRLIRSALSGGGLATLVFMGASLGLGSVGDREALQLLESTLPTIRFLCSAAIGAAATVMALMLTLLGLSRDLDSEINPDYYRRIQHIGTMCVICLVGGVGLLLVLTIPLGENDALATWYNVVYYGVLVVASLLGGLLVTITLTLRFAVLELVAAAHPEASSSMIMDEEEEDPEEASGGEAAG